MKNVVLIGFMGTGKSSCGKAAAQQLGYRFVDLDKEIEDKYGMTIPEMFQKYGEAYFREREKEMVRYWAAQKNTVISTGGGCVTVPDNYRLLHQNGIIVWIKRDTKKLARDGRPISLSSDMDRLYSSRRSFYECFADLTVDNNGDIKDTVNAITEMIK